MTALATSPTALRQVALARGENLDETLAFWRDVLGLAIHARFDPPGIAFILIGDIRLFFSPGAPPSTVYLDLPELLAAYRAAPHLMSPPTLVHVDAAGQFGPPGEAE